MMFDHYTDEELIRYAQGQAGLIAALSERLEMRLRDLDEVERVTQARRDHRPPAPGQQALDF